MIQTYCLHHIPATDRKEYLLKNFDTNNWHWITDYLPTDEQIVNHRRVSCEHSANKQNFLNAAELSLFYKHKLAIEIINQKQEFSLIVEDDIERPNFDLQDTINIFLRMMLEHSTDILFVGSYGNCDLNLQSPNILCNNYTLSRCTHAYILNPKCSKMLSKYLADVKAPIDWQLNYAINDLNLKSCWSSPHLYQRTEKMHIASLIRKNIS
jgi:hypothetical protein